LHLNRMSTKTDMVVRRSPSNPRERGERRTRLRDLRNVPCRRYVSRWYRGEILSLLKDKFSWTNVAPSKGGGEGSGGVSKVVSPLDQYAHMGLSSSFGTTAIRLTIE